VKKEKQNTQNWTRFLTILKNYQIKYKSLEHSALIYQFLNDDQKSILKKMMPQYGFRIFLKSIWPDLLSGKENHIVLPATQYLSVKKEQEFYQLLKKYGVFKLFRQLKKDSASSIFRYDLFFSEFLREQLWEKYSILSLLNVKILDYNEGGDIDMLCFLNDRLFTFEIKTSPPNNVQIMEIGAFLKRARQFNQWIHIFFIDTTLRLEDKIIPMFEESLYYQDGEESFIQNPVSKIEENAYLISPNILIANVKPRLSIRLRRLIHQITII
jgi:hypothetical protein